MSLTAPSKASLRWACGVVPACPAVPSTSNSSQRQPLDAGDHADGNACLLQTGALFDVGFQIRCGREPAGRMAASGSAASVSANASLNTVPAASRTGISSDRERTPLKTCEPIAPGANRPPSSLLHATTSMERSGRIPALDSAATASRPRQHPIHAVEASAAGLAVEVAARQHGSPIGPLAGITQEEIADRILGHHEAVLAGPLVQQTPRRTVLGGECCSVHARLAAAADLRHGHEARHKTAPPSMVGSRPPASAAGAGPMDRSILDEDIVRRHRSARVDGNDVLRTGRHHHDAIDERPENHAVAGLRDGFSPLERPARQYRDVHP